MATVALTGKDTLKINGRILNDLVDGDCAALTHPNDRMVVKTGKNGNSIYAYNQMGKIVELVLRVLRGSSDDKFLNGLLSSMDLNPPGLVLMNGEFTKNIGDGAGGIQGDTYICGGGAFKKGVDVKENQEGETEQAVSIWTIVFSNAPRVIG